MVKAQWLPCTATRGRKAGALSTQLQQWLHVAPRMLRHVLLHSLALACSESRQKVRIASGCRKQNGSQTVTNAHFHAQGAFPCIFSCSRYCASLRWECLCLFPSGMGSPRMGSPRSRCTISAWSLRTDSHKLAMSRFASCKPSSSSFIRRSVACDADSADVVGHAVADAAVGGCSVVVIAAIWWASLRLKTQASHAGRVCKNQLA